MLNDVFYGSVEGGWVYPLVNGDADWPVQMGVALSVAAAALVWVSYRFVERWPLAVIGAWLVFGTGAQLVMRTLAPFPDTHVVGSPTDYFNNEARNYPPGKFLRDFRELAPHLHFHARANMAGKVLFYHVIRAVWDTPPGLLVLIIGASNLGAVLAYAIARELFRDRCAGLAALALYLFLPSKLFFLPLLNSVTPVFILFALWLFLRYLADRHPGWLIATGTALYALVLFEPLPLVTGLTFLALIGRAWTQRAIGAPHVLAIFTLIPLAFFATNLAVAQLFGYEIVSAFLFALRDATEFNIAENRPYWVWLVYNLIETLSNTGVLTSALVLGIAGTGAYRMARALGAEGWSGPRAVACEPGVCLALSVLTCLAAVDVMGVNRGETVRLWIFLGAFLLLPGAGFCARRPVALMILLTGSIVQACVGLGTRGFIMPG
ncbi:hypothetical protein J8F10_08270 [Gemmata sp. G18]|uniref:Glycosyltransferase RgtA/B/C/D-like domain-containing protein n=1 Tax=Gemmata palustris TaxID=2822762 RepID=A0ABS5BNF8_9BACT|nr:hypothetical protein [Gemmata palustris]MBP3955274.1 hypothetical protein [Gemmata palustris]